MPSLQGIVSAFDKVPINDPTTRIEINTPSRDIFWHFKLVQLISFIVLVVLYKYCLYLSENGFICGLFGALLTYCTLATLFSFSRKEKKYHMVLINAIAFVALVYIGIIITKEYYNISRGSFKNDLSNGTEFLMSVVVVYVAFIAVLFGIETVMLGQSR